MNKYEVWFGAIRPEEGVHTGRIYRVTRYEPILIKYQHILCSLSGSFSTPRKQPEPPTEMHSVKGGGGQVHEYNNNSAS